jgi:beta-mannosidase
MEIHESWQFRQKGKKDEWHKATVPGTVHTDLVSSGMIENPFYRDNENKAQWVEQEEWEYKTQFHVDKELLQKENIELVFKGLDTYAKVFLNNTLLLETNNMFRQWKADIKSLLKEGDNYLYIHFLSPVKQALPRWQQLGYELPGGSKVMTRKPGYHYGWDWGPRLVTSGIWQPVVLEAWDKAKIESLQLVREEIHKQKALVTAVFEILSTTRQEATAAVEKQTKQAKPKTLNQASVQLVPGKNRVSFTFKIKNPKLWWSNGLGKPHLYHLKGILKVGNRVMDEVSQKIGLRTLEVVREREGEGETFYFKLNGVPLFIKGANYVPQDTFLTRVTAAQYKKLVKSTRDAHMNMLRVWGGGIYEKDIFYDLCDKAGILVWQDFMFACAMYPGDKDFLENVRQEAVENVKRLRHHPCIALWCGNNEINEAWHHWGWQEQFSPKQRERIWEDYQKLFHELLPRVAAEYDSHRFYWPSSPKFGRGNERSQYEGDSHYWGVWHDGQPFDMFKEKVPRFMSEFGFQAFPTINTLKRFTLPQDRSGDSPVMMAHQKNPGGNQVIKTYMKQDYRVPEDFEHFLFVSQVLQAEGMRKGIEAHRRAKPYCMGTLYWQLNDCWPAVSWSGIDYYHNWKALHYLVKKAFQPVLVSPVQEKGQLRVYIISDQLNPLEGRLSLQLMDLAGKNLWKTTIPCRVQPNSSRNLFEIDVKKLLEDHNRRDLVLVTAFHRDGKSFSSNLYYFVPPKDLLLAAPFIEKKISLNGKDHTIVLSCEKLAKSVYLSTDGVNGFFTDNYFDLLPGQPVEVHFTSDKVIDNLEQKLKILSLFDTLKR